MCLFKHPVNAQKDPCCGPVKCCVDLALAFLKHIRGVCAMILDYKVPFVPSDKEYEVVFIREGQQVVIPCRGSVENLNVTLQTVRKRVFFFFFLFSSCHFSAKSKLSYKLEQPLSDERQNSR